LSIDAQINKKIAIGLRVYFEYKRSCKVLINKNNTTASEKIKKIFSLLKG
jgi:hypothetical protein